MTRLERFKRRWAWRRERRRHDDDYGYLEVIGWVVLLYGAFLWAHITFWYLLGWWGSR